MSYSYASAKEVSEHGGMPVELYEFSNGITIWRYTSADYVVETSAGIVEGFVYNDPQGRYIPEQLQRSDLGETQEINKTNVKVTMAKTCAVAKIFLFYPPTSVTSITLSTFHFGEQGTLVESDSTKKIISMDRVTVLWTGRVLNMDLTNNLVELHCEPILTSIKRLGLRMFYQRQCPHILYEGGCAVGRSKEVGGVTISMKEQFSTEVVIAGSTGLTVYVSKGTEWVDVPEVPEVPAVPEVIAVPATFLTPEVVGVPAKPAVPAVPATTVEMFVNREFVDKPENYFAGGMMSWTVAGKGIQWRFIGESHDWHFSVNLPFKAGNDDLGRNLPAGQKVRLYPGCQHTLTICATRFNNLENYGGYPFIPLDNPFTSGTLY